MLSSLEREWEAPDELVEQTMDLIASIGDDKEGKIAIGVNETTKAVDRGNTKLVVIARDVNPQEIIMHLPVLCREKDVEYIFVDSKKELGNNAGINVAATSVAIKNPGGKEIELKKLIQLIKEAKLRAEQE